MPIGEVAAIEGRCYGLVAPGYTTAEVVADRLLDGDRRVPRRRPVHELKLLGVDVASFGDAMGARRARWRSWSSDPIGRTYAKLVLSDDAQDPARRRPGGRCFEPTACCGPLVGASCPATRSR